MGKPRLRISEVTEYDLKTSRERSRGKKASHSVQILPQHGHKRRARTTDKVFLREKAAQMSKRPTGAEAFFKRKLQEAGIKFKFQSTYNIQGIKGIFDFYLPDHNTVIEVDGGYHNSTDQKQTDDIKDFICETRLKRNMIRLTNETAMQMNIEDVKNLISALPSVTKPRQVKQREHPGIEQVQTAICPNKVIKGLDTGKDDYSGYRQ